jgi:hypothetical protein
MEAEGRLPRELLPDGTTHLDTQVAGHPFDAQRGRIGEQAYRYLAPLPSSSSSSSTPPPQRPDA